MKITKIEDKYTFTKQGNDYHLDLGVVKRYDDKTVALRVEGVEANQFYLKPTCGCTVVDQKVLDSTTLIVGVRYKDCDAVINKVLEIREGETKTLTGLIKLTGKCHNNSI